MSRNRTWTALALALLLLSGCGGQAEPGPDNDETFALAAEIGRGSAYEAGLALPTAAGDPQRWDDSAQIQKMADLGEDLSLYGLHLGTRRSVLVQWGETQTVFDWAYFGPQGLCLFPCRMDVDGDGADELVVNLAVAWEGIRAYELHVVERDPQTGALTDYVFPEGLYRQVEGMLSLETDGDQLRISIPGGQADLARRDEGYEPAGIVPLDWQVSYEVDEAGIVACFRVGAYEPQYGFSLSRYAELTAEVSYAEGVYTLSGFRLNG